MLPVGCRFRQVAVAVAVAVAVGAVGRSVTEGKGYDRDQEMSIKNTMQ